MSQAYIMSKLTKTATQADQRHAARDSTGEKKQGRSEQRVNLGHMMDAEGRWFS